jgi:hypothetical protein
LLTFVVTEVFYGYLIYDLWKYRLLFTGTIEGIHKHVRNYKDGNLRAIGIDIGTQNAHLSTIKVASTINFGVLGARAEYKVGGGTSHISQQEKQASLIDIFESSINSGIHSQVRPEGGPAGKQPIARLGSITESVEEPDLNESQL